MSYRNKTVIVNVIEASDADLVKQTNLINLFEFAVYRVATMQARKAEFNTNDFPTAEQRKCLNYRLEITREQEASGLYFLGVYTKGDYRLSITGRFN